MSGTELSDLPTSIAGISGIAEPQQQQPTDQSGAMTQPQQPPINCINSENIPQFVSGIQAAAMAGYTQFPLRNTTHDRAALTMDPQTQVNYIQPPAIKDYIHDAQTHEQILKSYNRQAHADNINDVFFDELKTPLLLVIMYFLFQLPIFREWVARFVPSAFGPDLNYSGVGVIMVSCAFGVGFYMLTKVMQQFNRF